MQCLGKAMHFTSSLCVMALCELKSTTVPLIKYINSRDLPVFSGN